MGPLTRLVLQQDLGRHATSTGHYEGLPSRTAPTGAGLYAYDRSHPDAAQDLTPRARRRARQVDSGASPGVLAQACEATAPTGQQKNRQHPPRILPEDEQHP